MLQVEGFDSWKHSWKLQMGSMTLALHFMPSEKSLLRPNLSVTVLLKSTYVLGDSRKHPYPTTGGIEIVPPLPSEIPKCPTPHAFSIPFRNSCENKIQRGYTLGLLQNKIELFFST